MRRQQNLLDNHSHSLRIGDPRYGEVTELMTIEGVGYEIPDKLAEEIAQKIISHLKQI